jgi:hypothetical protein
MASISCDGTVVDNVSLNDVLFTINTNGEKKYLVYGSAYFIIATDGLGKTYKRCDVWSPGDTDVLTKLINKHLPYLLKNKENQLNIHKKRPYAQFTLVSNSAASSIGNMKLINNLIFNPPHNLKLGNSSPLNVPVVIKCSCRAFEVGEDVCFFSNSETGEGREVGRGKIVKIDKEDQSYLVNYKKYLDSEEAVLVDRNIVPENIWSPKKLKESFSTTDIRLTNDGKRKAYYPSSNSADDAIRGAFNNSQRDKFYSTTSRDNNNEFESSSEDLVKVSLRIKRPNVKLNFEKYNEEVKLLENKYLNEMEKNNSSYEDVCQLAAKIAYLKWQLKHQR